jgi:predicted nucleotidyltransferase component of viral defense system
VLVTLQPKIEELLGTKLRALYQRRKGRDLFDIHKSLEQLPDLNKKDILDCYHQYMKFVVDHPPSKKIYLQNIEAKMQDDEFMGDIAGIIWPTEQYNQSAAYELVNKNLLYKLI